MDEYYFKFRKVADKRVRQLLKEHLSDHEIIEQLSSYGRKLILDTLAAVKAESAQNPA
jgi:hypothetical protein